jgi:hypothetical protein
VSGGLRELPKTKLSTIPRMADFALFGEAVCRGLGYEEGKFLDVYRSNRKAANESALEDSHVAGAIRELVAVRGWMGTATELKDALELIVTKKIADSERWPKSPRGMSGTLRRLAPSLRQVGISVEFGDRTKKVRSVITIEPADKQGKQQSPQSPQSPVHATLEHSTDNAGDGHVTVGDGTASTVIQPSPTQNVFLERLISMGDGGDGDDGRIPTLNNGHTENLREVLEI